MNRLKTYWEQLYEDAALYDIHPDEIQLAMQETNVDILALMKKGLINVYWDSNDNDFAFDAVDVNEL